MRDSSLHNFKAVVLCGQPVLGGQQALGQRSAGIGLREVCSGSPGRALSTELTSACCYCPSFYQGMPWGFRVLEQGGFEALNEERDWEQKTQKGLLGFSFL